MRIEWDSTVGHEEDFRSSPQFGEIFAAVKPFFDQIQEMKHYQIRAPDRDAVTRLSAGRGTR